MTHQAALLHEQGSQLRLGTVEHSSAGNKEVVVKNHAIAINPIDWKQQDFGLYVKQYPIILGSDVAGDIIEVGSGVSNFKVGDRVIGHATALATGEPKNGAFQQQTVLSVDKLAKIPASLSYEQASVLPLGLSTAAAGLYGSKADGFFGLSYPSVETHGQSSGKVLVVYGGSSSVGALTIQLAAASGAKVVTLASEKNFKFVHDAGATEAFDYKDKDVVAKVTSAVEKLGGEFVGVYDTISLEGQSYNITIPLTQKLGGSLVTTLPAPKDVPAGVKTVNVFGVVPAVDPVWQHFVEPALASGQLKAIPEAYIIGSGLESLQAGMNENKKGVSAKKVVVKL